MCSPACHAEQQQQHSALCSSLQYSMQHGGVTVHLLPATVTQCAGQEVLLQVLEQQQLLSDRVMEELTLVRDCCCTMQIETRVCSSFSSAAVSVQERQRHCIIACIVRMPGEDWRRTCKLDLCSTQNLYADNVRFMKYAGRPALSATPKKPGSTVDATRWCMSAPCRVSSTGSRSASYAASWR
jgi:hypothetical protein